MQIIKYLTATLFQDCAAKKKVHFFFLGNKYMEYVDIKET